MRGIALGYEAQTTKASCFGKEEKCGGKFLAVIDENFLTILGLDGRKGGSKCPEKGEKDESSLGSMADDLRRGRSRARVPIMFQIEGKER